jgi:prepilin-type N-terminal cleavage/methylation domain-containing protein
MRKPRMNADKQAENQRPVGARRLRRFTPENDGICEAAQGIREFRTRSGVNAVPRSSCRLKAGLRTSGFSLVEILCAVLILGVALTGLVQGVTTGLSSNKESELQTVAALFAAGQVETLRAEGDLHDGTTDGECGEGLSLYRWQQTLSHAGIDGLYDVTVVVENSKSGKAIYELRTLLFEVPDDSRANSSNSRRDTGSQRRRSGSR